MSESEFAKTIRQYANYDDNNPGRHNLMSWSNEIERLEVENAKLRLDVQALRNSLRLNAETILKLSEDIVRLKGGE